MDYERNKTTDVLDPVDWLRREYVRRKSKNHYYSMRAFARHLSIPPGPLSEILSSKRPFTAKQARKIAENLALGPEDVMRLLAMTSKREKQEGADVITRRLDSDKFNLISDWYHYAILSLLETRPFKSDPKWIAKRLGISTAEAVMAIERLVRLGLIEKKGNQIVASQGWTTSNDIPSAAIRKFHRQTLERSLEALENIAVDSRDISSITMAVNLAKWDEAKGLIKNFRRKMAKLLEDGEKTEVYQLNIQLVPVTKGKKP